jgi:AraC-like DNA-binding protein
MVFRRKAAKGLHSSRVETPAQDRGLLIGVSLVDGHRRKAREGARRHDRIFDRGDLYIRDFDADYSAAFDGYFDFFLIELAPDFLRTADKITDGATDADLIRVQAKQDQVLRHLAHALLPTLAEPDAVDPLFVEQLSTAIGAHLLTCHRARPNPVTGNVHGLTSVMVRRAQEMLMAGDEERASLATIADALGLSRNHFFRAFRETTGVTPYQWLLNQRIDHARRLLRTTDLPLAEIALHCGFSDQSHFTRVFGRIEGASPGRWRERTR